MLATNADLFARRGAPVPIVRADWTVIDEAWKADSGEFHRVVVTPAEASAMGAGAICMYLIGGPATGEMFAGNVAAVAKAAREADRVGLPLIVEATLWGSRHADKKDPEAVQHMCRIAYELGDRSAHLVAEHDADADALALLAAHDPQVGAADRVRLDLEQDLARTRRRVGQLGEFGSAGP